LKGKSATQREFRIVPEVRKRLVSKPSWGRSRNPFIYYRIHHPCRHISGADTTGPAASGYCACL